MKNWKCSQSVLWFVAGVLLVFGLRFAFAADHSVHYHSNFGLFVNGAEDKFDSFTFYEEVASCSAEHADPKLRTHMHDHKAGLIHVHATGVTWGHFFANLGYGLTDKSITTDAGTFVDGQNGKKLTFVLNGVAEPAVANRLIASEDRLLISFGNESEAELQSRYQAVPADALEYNSKADPAACAGDHDSSLMARLKRAFDVTK